MERKNSAVAQSVATEIVQQIVYPLSSASYVPTDAGMEHPVGESLTVPDETYTIREIVERFVRGNEIDESFLRSESEDSGADFDSEDLEKVSGMDLFDREELLQETKSKIESSKVFLEKQKKAKERASLRASDEGDDGIKVEDKKSDEAKKPAPKAKSVPEVQPDENIEPS